MLTTLLLITVGVIVGIIGAVLGIGGGVIIVPLLVFMKVPIHEAIATSLVVITANSLSTSAVYIKSGMANMNMGFLMGTTAVFGSMIGSAVAISMPQYAVMIVLGCIQLFIAYLTFMKTRPKNAVEPHLSQTPTMYDGSYIDKATDKRVSYSPVRVWANAVFGIFSGIFSGLSGAGGGAMLIPGMNVISAMPMKAATATSTFIMGFTAMTGGIIYMKSGYVVPELTASIILGISAGTAIAVKFFSKITDKKVSYIFTGILLIVAAQMLYKGITFHG